MGKNNLVYPNDLVYCYLKPLTKEPPSTSHGNDNNVNYEDASTSSSSNSTEEVDGTLLQHRQPLQSYLSFITFPVDTTLDQLIVNIKYGFDTSTSKAAIPFTCYESGLTVCQKLDAVKIALADRYFDVNSWVNYNGKIGQVKNIKSIFDLHVRNSSLVIKNIPEIELEIVPQFYPGQYLFSKGWIGCVKLVQNKLLVRYSKGHECQIFEKDYDAEGSTDEECNFPRPDFQALQCGDTISPSARDIKFAKWVQGKSPGLIQWLFLRYLNWGYTESTCAKVLANTVESITVEWYVPPTFTDQLLVPKRKITGKALEELVKLDLNWFWYGMNANYRTKISDVLQPLSDWGQAMADLVDFPLKINKGRLDQFKYQTNDVITGKVIGRQATAVVRWEDATVSQIPVKDLALHYFVTDSKTPFTIGEVVIKSLSGSALKILFGIVQKCQPGLCYVKWFGTESADTLLSPTQVKIWDSTDAVETLQVCNEYKFPIGIIALTKAENVPGIVIGNNFAGQVYVKLGQTVNKYYAYELYKFEHIAFSVGFGRDIIWSTINSENLTLNQKQIGFSFANIFNLTIPTSVIQSIPETNPFEVVKEPPTTHRFFNEVSANPINAKLKDLLKEQIDLAKKNHANGIWIKTFEERMDLMSVLMTGMPGSLYEGALFQFEICFPTNYPNVHPLVLLSPKYGIDRLVLTKFHSDIMDKTGLLKLEKILGKRADLPLWLVLTGIQEGLFGVHQILRDEETDRGGALNTLKKIAFSSYTDQFQSGVQNQMVLRNLINSMTRWLIAPPKLWENEAWVHWKINIPLFIARVKRMVRLCEEHYEHGLSEPEGKYDLLATALLPPDAILMNDIDLALHDLTLAYGKMY